MGRPNIRRKPLRKKRKPWQVSTNEASERLATKRKTESTLRKMIEFREFK